MENGKLKKTLGPVMLWGLGVGYVISGSYFGWNLGLPHGGPYGMLIATVLVTVMYVTFVFSYTELSCAIPKAGGVFVYASMALGKRVGFLAGMAQLIEFMFAPPAIAAAIGAYFAVLIPGLSPLLVAAVAYVLFTGLNIAGVKHSAIFELVITIIAVVELFIFAAVVAPSFSWGAFSQNPLPNGVPGILAAIPYAIWFYLAIEGVANVAEETKNPQRDIRLGFTAAIVTLTLLTALVFFSAIGVAGWEAIVFADGSTTASDSPLPLALSHVVGTESIYFHLITSIGIFGLVASFHGIILISGRALLEFGRMGYAPKVFGITLRKQKTPAPALLATMFVGGVALLTGKTGEIITLAVFGAITLYILSMISVIRLRKLQPNLHRPYKTPFYPIFPYTALILAVLCMVAMVIYNFKIALVYLGILGLSYAYYFIYVESKDSDMNLGEACGSATTN